MLLTRETLKDHIDEEVGVSPWIEITQDMVDQFADVTRDHQFIHVDLEQAKQTPFGGTIAHGFLSLSMLSWFSLNGCGVGMENASFGLNYGLDKVRFLSPVRVGARIRGRSVLVAADETKPNQFRFTLRMTVEIEGEDRPALVADWLNMAVVG